MRTWRNLGGIAKVASFLATKLAVYLATISASLATMLECSTRRVLSGIRTRTHEDRNNAILIPWVLLPLGGCGSPVVRVSDQGRPCTFVKGLKKHYSGVTMNPRCYQSPSVMIPKTIPFPCDHNQTDPLFIREAGVLPLPDDQLPRDRCSNLAPEVDQASLPAHLDSKKQ
ncbi:hypothetical protein TNCV_561021 [Trichonephila clavipes]|nr:hypothetical protein TNCV_561021 [Trichonephila clavipes]